MSKLNYERQPDGTYDVLRASDGRKVVTITTEKSVKVHSPLYADEFRELFHSPLVCDRG